MKGRHIEKRWTAGVYIVSIQLSWALCLTESPSLNGSNFKLTKTGTAYDLADRKQSSSHYSLKVILVKGGDKHPKPSEL